MMKCSMLFLLMPLMLACGVKKADESHEDRSEESIERLSKKYNAVSNWDTTRGFTSFYQRKFIEQGKLMLFSGRIYDIVKRDSDYVVKVLDDRKDADHNFLAVITFSSKELDDKLTDDKSTSGVFVIRIMSITTSDPSIKEEEESDGDDRSVTYSHLSDDADKMITIFRGKMVDCVFEKIEKEN